MTTTSPKATKRGNTSPAPKKTDAEVAKLVKTAVKAKAKANKARTPVKGKTTAKKPAKKRTAPGTPRAGTRTVDILKLAARPKGVSREELNDLTKWTGAPWRWNFTNPKGTGYCDRFGYTLKVLEGKDGEVRYHVTKK